MTNEINDIRNKILAGLKISSRRLVEHKKLRNMDLVISKNGQIRHVKPQEIKLD
jgi:hypothetical protein